MKKTLMTLAAFVLTLVAVAGPIDKQQALNTAKAFMKDVNPQAVLQTTTVKHAPGLQGNMTSQPYYIFNAENNKGFVIVSGDDRSEEILGYSDEGYFDCENLPEALEGMLSGFVEDLKELDKLGITEPAESVRNKAPRKAVSVGRRPIAPLTKSIWNQGLPFSLHTPTSSGSHAPTGCVATAVAQLLYYWKYIKIPSTGIPGYTQSGGDFDGEVFKALDYREFDFNQMQDSYVNVSSSSDEGKLIGDFMQYIDQGLGAKFGIEGTYINPTTVPGNVKKYFGYTYATAMYRRVCGAETFENYIYNDLAQDHPVWTAGHSMPGRHSFLIDGYSYDDFFHINWGWQGICNGYFRLAPLSAYNKITEHCYANHLYGMFGAHPNAAGYGDDYTSYVPATIGSTILSNMYFTVDEETTTTAAQSSTNSFDVALSTVLVNRTGSLGSKELQTFNVELAILDANMAIVGTLKPDVNEVTIQQAYSTVVNYTLGSKLHSLNLADGEYKVVPRSHVTGYKNFFFDKVKGKYAYVKMVKNGTKIDLSLVQAYTVDGSEFIGQMNEGYKSVFRVHFTNNTLGKLERTMSLYKDKIADTSYSDEKETMVKSGMCDTKQLRVEPLSTCIVDFGFEPGTDTNSHKLLVVDKELDFDNSSAADIHKGTTVHQASYTGNTTSTVSPTLTLSWNVQNTSSSNIYGNELHGYVRVTNSSSSEYQDYLTIKISTRTITGYGSNKYVCVVYPVKIAARGYVDLDLGEFNYTDLIAKDFRKGETEYIQFTVYKGNSAQIGSAKKWTTNNNAYMWWDKNGKMTAATSMSSIPETAVAVSFMDMSAGSLKPNSNPNTIYYFSSTPSTSSSFYSHNFVVGSRTGTKTAPRAITFVDDEGAYVPYSFIAEDGVSYTRTFDYGYENSPQKKGYSTICLPFKVETVNNGQKDIDWFHSSSDKNKLFWVNKFYGEDYTVIVYDFTETMEANTPYLIEMPGTAWGEKWSLIDKPITFSAGNNAKVLGGYEIESGIPMIDTDNQNFVSAAMAYRELQKGKSVYSIENPGNDFEYVPNPDLKSFRGYITKETSTSLVNLQRVAVINLGENEFEGGETDGIQSIENGKRTIENGVVYDLQGRVVSTKGLQALPKGIYIMNGKKYTK